MKTSIRLIVNYIIYNILVYLQISFYYLSFNPANFEVSTRYLLASNAFFSIFVFIAIYIYLKLKQND